MSKIGILGGTFDPPHVAHIEIAQAARAQLELDEVILVPAGRSPFKLTEDMSLAKH
jgi:nicotinate-nucleotide adenylyltransferase